MFCIVVQQPPSGSLRTLSLQCGLSLDPGVYLRSDTRNASYVLLFNPKSTVPSVEQTRVPMHSRAEQSAQRCATTYTAAFEQNVHEISMRRRRIPPEISSRRQSTRG